MVFRTVEVIRCANTFLVLVPTYSGSHLDATFFPRNPTSLRHSKNLGSAFSVSRTEQRHGKLREHLR